MKRVLFTNVKTSAMCLCLRVGVTRGMRVHPRKHADLYSLGHQRSRISVTHTAYYHRESKPIKMCVCVCLSPP